MFYRASMQTYPSVRLLSCQCPGLRLNVLDSRLRQFGSSVHAGEGANHRELSESRSWPALGVLSRGPLATHYGLPSGQSECLFVAQIRPNRLSKSQAIFSASRVLLRELIPVFELRPVDAKKLS